MIDEGGGHTPWCFQTQFARGTFHAFGSSIKELPDCNLVQRSLCLIVLNFSTNALSAFTAGEKHSWREAAQHKPKVAKGKTAKQSKMMICG